MKETEKKAKHKLNIKKETSPSRQKRKKAKHKLDTKISRRKYDNWVMLQTDFIVTSRKYRAIHHPNLESKQQEDISMRN